MLTFWNSRGMLLAAIFSSGVRTVWHPQAAESATTSSQRARRRSVLEGFIRNILSSGTTTSAEQAPGGATETTRRGRSRTAPFILGNGLSPVASAPDFEPDPHRLPDRS